MYSIATGFATAILVDTGVLTEEIVRDVSKPKNRPNAWFKSNRSTIEVPTSLVESVDRPVAAEYVNAKLAEYPINPPEDKLAVATIWSLSRFKTELVV